MTRCPQRSGGHGGRRISTFGFQQDDGGDADFLKLFEDGSLMGYATHNNQFTAHIRKSRYASDCFLKQGPISS